MLGRIKIGAMFMVVLLGLNTVWAERTYEYVEKVGSGYEHATIQSAIDAMNEHSLGPDALGCIEVYPDPGTYEHNAGIYAGPYKDESKWLPMHCDLKGMGGNIDDVLIEIPVTAGINHFVIIGSGDNYILHLKVYVIRPNFGARNGIYLFNNGRVTDCIVETAHVSVHGAGENFVVTGCEIAGLTCVRAVSTFAVSDCTLNPRGSYPVNDPVWLEGSCGVSAQGTGTIENVTISGSAEAAAHCDCNGWSLGGVRLQLDADEYVSISNVQIDLELTSVYHPDYYPNVQQVYGVLSGKRKSFEPDNSFPGLAVVRDCTISVTGIEDDGGTPGDPSDDGGEIMVDGVCLRGGGTVEVYSFTSIITSRTAAGEDTEGYECLVNEENGTLAVNFAGVHFGPTGAFCPSIEDIDELWEPGFYVKNNQDEVFAWFDTRGNVVLKGTLEQNSNHPATGHDEFRFQDVNGVDVAIIDAANGKMYIKGTLKLDSENNWVAPTDGDDNFRIQDSGGNDVAYISKTGDLYLKGKLYENAIP